MSLFKRNNPVKAPSNQAGLAEIALKAIHDGVVMTDRAGVIQYVNPAAVTMLDCGSADKAIGLDYGLLIKLETKEGRELSDTENPLIQAMNTGQPLEAHQACLIDSSSAKRIPVAISVLPVEGLGQNRIITFRNIAKELEEEGEQTEFISTASHEMRTPVATIDGYLSLTLNPQTATIDERARGYLTAAQNASRHLGKLFQDLLDVTRLDDGKIRPNFVPTEMVSLIKTISDDYQVRAKEAGLNYTFGSDQPLSLGEGHRMEQVVYSSIDVDFIREIMDNLIENAIKYTPSGGSIYVNVRGDGDRVLINVTDSGIGISADDLGHIFQKFYRADNSDTRTIGGNGLGLYLVKQRVEAMGGRVWAESAFGEGSTFYVSLPRITSDEYEKRMIAFRNKQQFRAQWQAAAAEQPAIPHPVGIQPAMQPNMQPTAQPTMQPATQPITVQQLATLPQPQPATLTQPQSLLTPRPQPVVLPQPQPVVVPGAQLASSPPPATILPHQLTNAPHPATPTELQISQPVQSTATTATSPPAPPVPLASAAPSISVATSTPPNSPTNNINLNGELK